MDISKLDSVAAANEGEVLELLHPVSGIVLNDGKGKKPKKFFLRLLGNDSDVYRSMMKRRFEQYQKKKKNNIDFDDATQKAAELLAACTIDCFIMENDKPIEFSKAEMMRLYLKLPWLREQAEEFMGDRANFMKS